MKGGINIRKPQDLTYNLGRELGATEYLAPLDDDASDVYNDEEEDLKTSESEGWHPHHGAQHVFGNGTTGRNSATKTRRFPTKNPALSPEMNWR